MLYFAEIGKKKVSLIHASQPSKVERPLIAVKGEGVSKKPEAVTPVSKVPPSSSGSGDGSLEKAA